MASKSIAPRRRLRRATRQYAAGTYVVPMAQPSKRLIRTLLDPDTKMDDKFVAAEEARRKLKQRNRDLRCDRLVAATTLQRGGDCQRVRFPPAVSKPAKPSRIVPGEMHGGAASVAYLVPWGGQAAGRLLTAALRAGFDGPLERQAVHARTASNFPPAA